MENEKLCTAMERWIPGMPAGKQDIFREAVRRLRICGGRSADRVVELASSLATLQEFAVHLTEENEKLKGMMQESHRELHVHYDLEAEGLGAVLQEGQNRYSVSALALAELLVARRDGRLIVLDKEEKV